MKRLSYYVDGHLYFLNPEYKKSATGRIYVTGCEMYNKDNEYVGFWYRHNMPVNLIGEMAKHVRTHDANVPTEVQEVRGYKRRVPRRNS